MKCGILAITDDCADTPPFPFCVDLLHDSVPLLCGVLRPGTPSIVYVCPLKALNLGERLDRYTRMIGRRSAIWHGDIGQSQRKQTRVEPPDILLTTPESLEGMLISTNTEMKTHLRNLRAVVVD